MRLATLVALAAGLGCRSHTSKLDNDRAAAADALWALAPEHTELAIIATPRAVGLAARGVTAVRGLMTQPDFAPLKPQVDSLVRRMFGSETATPADAGYASDRGFAMFATADGVLAVMPVSDRDKFMAVKRGTRGSAEDTLEGNVCRPVRDLYMCATNPAMFDRIGSGALRGKLAIGSTRGDVEIYVSAVTLLGDTKGELAVAAQLDEGELAVSGRWLGTPSGFLAKLVAAGAPHPDTKGASGFVAINVAPLLGDLAPVPLAGNVTLGQLAKTLVGPISAIIPAGSVDIQVFAPLGDTTPATAVIDHCQELGNVLALADKQVPGACRILLQGTNALELDVWVDSATLRIGAHKGPLRPGGASALTAVSRQLAASEWTAVLWGRGSMLNLTGVTPASREVESGVALGIHSLALINELGAAANVANDGVRFRVYLRTAWTNPPDLLAKLVAIGGNEIATGKAAEAAKSLAAASPGTPFAADFAAGQGGLMVPAATIGLVAAVVVPAVLRALDDGDRPPGKPVDKPALASLLVHSYVEEAYPKWQAQHRGKPCPASLDEVAKYLGNDPAVPLLTDPWARPLAMKCDATGFKVFSLGEDGQAGTDDDIRSW